MTLRHLTIFITVAESGSMSEAARRLFISQPSVSQTIHELEEHFQVLLFERLGRRLYITEAGKKLLFYARHVTDNYDILEKTMFKQHSHPTLRLGSSITVGTCLIPSIINELESTIPDIEIISTVTNTQAIETMLLHSELDAAIVEGEIESPDLICMPIIEDDLVLVCSKAHELCDRDSICPGDLEGQRFAIREPGSGTRKLFEQYLNAHNISIKKYWEANCPRTILNAVLYNRALTVISLRLMNHELQKGKLKIFQNETGEWQRYFKLVYHRDKLITNEIATLREILEKYRELNNSLFTAGVLTVG